MRVPVANPGSTGLKAALVEDGEIVRTAEVGSGSARAAVAERLGWLGVRLDPDRNEAPPGEDRDIASDQSAVRVLVVAAREELVAAEHAAQVLARG